MCDCGTMLNTGLTKTERLFTSIESLGITSTYIPDIINAMPANSSFRALINGSGIADNAQNKLIAATIMAGIITIDKWGETYTRTIITTNTSGESNGKLYLGSIDVNTRKVNGW